MTEEQLTLVSKTLRPKMVLAVELFPLPVFPSNTSLISVEEEGGFLPEETKKEKDYVQKKETKKGKKKGTKKERKIPTYLHS